MQQFCLGVRPIWYASYQFAHDFPHHRLLRGSGGAAGKYRVILRRCA